MSASVQASGRSRKRRTIAEINVVPYIDVMLVLLIIFMVTAPFVNPAVVDLPSVARTSQTPKSLPLEVIINKEGALSLRVKEPKPDEFSIERARLIEEVHSRQAADPDLPVVISADKGVRYETVMDVMSDLQSANIKRVGLLVKPSGDRK